MKLFLIFRVLHILMAALWVGGTFVMSMFVAPAIQDATSAGGRILTGVAKRGYVMFVPAIAGLVTLTGFYLYYHYTNGFEPGISGSMAGRVFGTGALAGIIAAFTGSSVGRKTQTIAALLEQADAKPEGAEKGALMAQAAIAQGSLARSNRITLVLMVVAVATMSLGHYVG